MDAVTIQLNGPAKNALSTSMMRWLQQQLVEADGRPVLITGSGDTFSAGLDLKEVLGLDSEGARGFLDELDRAMFALFHYPGPVVGQVNGHAIAGGCVLALCCDHTVATDNPRSRIGLNEVALGLHFPPNILAVVRATVPPRHLERVVLGAGLHGPLDACAYGLVDEVSANAAEVAERRLHSLAAAPARAYAATKRALRGHVVLRDLDSFPHFLDEVLPVWTSDDIKGRIRAMFSR